MSRNNETVKLYEGIRVPERGENWIYRRCNRHRNATDSVLIGRSFDDQPEMLQRHILSLIRHGCFHWAGHFPDWDADNSD